MKKKIDIEFCRGIAQGLDVDSSYEGLWIDQLRSLESTEEISSAEYEYIYDHIDELLAKK